MGILVQAACRNLALSRIDLVARVIEGKTIGAAGLSASIAGRPESA